MGFSKQEYTAHKEAQCDLEYFRLKIRHINSFVFMAIKSPLIKIFIINVEEREREKGRKSRRKEIDNLIGPSNKCFKYFQTYPCSETEVLILKKASLSLKVFFFVFSPDSSLF